MLLIKVILVWLHFILISISDSLLFVKFQESIVELRSTLFMTSSWFHYFVQWANYINSLGQFWVIPLFPSLIILLDRAWEWRKHNVLVGGFSISWRWTTITCVCRFIILKISAGSKCASKSIRGLSLAKLRCSFSISLLLFIGLYVWIWAIVETAGENLQTWIDSRGIVIMLQLSLRLVM